MTQDSDEFPAAGLLPALHRIQESQGYISDEDVAQVARACCLSRAEVEGVIGFYADFRHSPAGRHRLAVCQGESCLARGGGDLAAAVRQRLGVAFGGTTADGTVSLEVVYCLGNCACSPAVLLDGRLLGRTTAADLETVLTDAIEQGKVS